ncbi:MAG: FxsA family protein [Rhodospirillales bacterium]|nr:FxsA family protein [Rhodospirillales bacterium]
MGLFILLALIVMPIVEIAVFIEVGGRIGLFNTIAVVFITAVAGTALLRWQGLSVLGRAQESLRVNRFPMEEVFDGLCLVFAGALLLTPGFVTDGIGFLLFLPPVRQILKRFAIRHISLRAQGRGAGARPDGVIDGDYVDITEAPEQGSPKATRLESKKQDDDT